MNDDVEAPARRPTELIVAPTRLRGRRSTLPGLAAAAAAVLFVGAAVWKPWAGGPAARSAPPSSAATAANAAGGPSMEPEGSVAPASGPDTTPTPATITQFPSDATMLAATTHEPVWGLRAIVIRDGPPGFPGEPHVVERWSAVDQGLVLGQIDPTAEAAPLIDPHDDVAALGVTTLDDDLALDVRFWHLSDEEPPRRLAPIPFAGPESGSWLWQADPAFRTAGGTWPAGIYRIDVLTSSRIVRLMVVIARPAAAPLPPDTAPVVQPPADWLLAGLDAGLVVVAGGRAVHLTGGNSATVDERGAWLGAAAGGTDVARVEALDVSAVGVVLPPGSEPGDIAIEELSPVPGPVELAIDQLPARPDDRRAIVARPALLGILPTGLYRVTMTSGAARSLLVSQTWTLEVVPPSEAGPPDAPLAALASWIPLIGDRDGRLGQPVVEVAGDGEPGCQASSGVTGHDRLLGIITPPGTAIERLRLIPNGVTQSADIPVRYAIDVVPRLTIVALPDGGLPIRDYTLVLTLDGVDDRTTTTMDLCVVP